MRLTVVQRHNALLRVFICALAFKLLISPWATGDFATASGLLLNYACDGVIFMVIALQLGHFPRAYAPFLWISLLTGVTYLCATVLYTDKSLFAALSTHLKLYLPLLAIPVLVSLSQNGTLSVPKIAFSVSLLVTGLIILGLLLLPPAVNRMQEWLPAYFGGLHTTAYVALMVLFTFLALWQQGYTPAKLSILLILSLAALIIIGWGVRTASLACLILLTGLASSRWFWNRRPVWHLLPPIIIGVMVGVLPLLDFSGHLDQFSSGRLSMYVAKYHQLAQNNFGQWLIGNGYNSDMITTEVWWWEAKGSHSDFITFLVEGGVIYLGGFLAVIALLFRQHTALTERLILVALLATSIFSNGIFVRPLPAYFLAIIFALYAYQRARVKSYEG